MSLLNNLLRLPLFHLVTLLLHLIGAQRPSTPEPMGAAQNPITVESSPESVDLREPVNCRPGRGIDLLAEVHRVSMELEEEDRAEFQPNKEEEG